MVCIHNRMRYRSPTIETGLGAKLGPPKISPTAGGSARVEAKVVSQVRGRVGGRRPLTYPNSLFLLTQDCVTHL